MKSPEAMQTALQYIHASVPAAVLLPKKIPDGQEGGVSDAGTSFGKLTWLGQAHSQAHTNQCGKIVPDPALDNNPFGPVPQAGSVKMPKHGGSCRCRGREMLLRSCVGPR